MALLKNDLTGKKIWDLEVLEDFQNSYSRPVENRKTIRKLKCKCKCGVIFFPFKTNVLRGLSKRCIYCGKNADLLGKKIGHLQVVTRYMHNLKPSYVCLCDCGDEFIALAHYLRHGKNPCCEKCRYPKKYIPKLTREEWLNNLSARALAKHEKALQTKIGKAFHYLTVLKFSHWENDDKRRRPYYLCKCKCKKKVTVRGDQLKTIKSCGCLQLERILRGEDQPKAILKNINIKSIRELIATRLYKNKEIAKMFKVSESYISQVKLNKKWRSI